MILRRLSFRISRFALFVWPNLPIVNLRSGHIVATRDLAAARRKDYPERVFSVSHVVLQLATLELPGVHLPQAVSSELA